MNGGYVNGYTNGYESSSNTPFSSRRPGGYGGLASPEPPRNRLYGQTPRPPDLERRRANRRSPERRTWMPQGEGRAVQEIEDILRYIDREWNFMAGNQCIPVQVALQLLDDSSLGLASRADEFRETQKRLQEALRGVVNEHHQGFNSSIGTFHQIQASIQASHERVRTLRDSLVQAKVNLSSAKPEYQSLSSSSRSYAEMLDILHSIEQVQQMPDRLETNISEKRFLAAVDCLQDALRLIRKSEMEDIGALGDIKVYLSNQEHSLTDILIEELHNHLYLKSPYCEDRWKRYSRSEQEKSSQDVLAYTGSRELFDFLDALDTSVAMSDDASNNPESDTFSYIQLIVESLGRLGRLGEAVDSIEDRLPMELYRVVERSNNEIQQRHPSTTRTDFGADDQDLGVLLEDKTRSVILHDLLDVLYARFEAIAEAHRVFHEVITGVSKRDDGPSNPLLTRGFKELWKLYQSEIRLLLHDYLSTGGSAAQRSGQGLSGEGNIFRQQRDKNKKCTFKLNLVDSQTGRVKSESDEVVAIWQKFVPGLVSRDVDLNSANASSPAQRLDSSAAGHKLIVRPSVFNIGCLLPPSVTFLNRLKEIVPPNTDIVVSTLSSFLNDFLINVFHPQLEVTITDFCAQSFTQSDAFHQDVQWNQCSQKPIFKGSIKFFEIVGAFCSMLADLTHDQLFTQLIITQMNTYYEKCSTWYKALVSRGQSEYDGRSMKASAMLSENAEVSAMVNKIAASNPEDKNALLQQESLSLAAVLRNRQLSESDMISDRKSEAQLCLVFNSITWLALKLSQLRKISDRATDSMGRRDSSIVPIKRTLTTSLLEESAASDTSTFLPLSSESARFFDGVIDAYEELASTVLQTLHLELRCRISFRLGLAIRGSYLYPDIADSPDEDVLALVNDLLEFDQALKAMLLSREYELVRDGITLFVDEAIVQSIVQNIRSLNSAGCDHLRLNARVLYHNLLNIEPKAELPRTFGFLHAFDRGPDEILSLAKAKSPLFSQQEVRALLELAYSEEMESLDQTKALSAKRALEKAVAHNSMLKKLCVCRGSEPEDFRKSSGSTHDCERIDGSDYSLQAPQKKPHN